MAPRTNTIADHKTTINRRRAERRRQVARTVRDVRDRLAVTEGERRDFLPERLMLFSNARLSVGYAIPMLAMIIAGISVMWIDPLMLAIWLAATLSMHLLTVLCCRKFDTSAAEGKELKVWQWRFTAGDFLCGCCWAIFFFLPAKAPAADGLMVFQFAAMLIVVAMTTMQSATLPRALLAGTLPITAALTATFVQEQTPVQFAMAAMAVGAQGFFLVLGNQLLNNTNTMLAFRAEKDHLIAELEQAKAVSDESRRRAEEANLAKSRFLATMSHELRTPLNAILGFSEIMQDEVLGPMENTIYKGYAADIHTSGQLLLNFINEILDLSRIEAGRYELNEEDLDLADCVEDCLHMMEIRATAKNIRVISEQDNNLPMIRADRRAIRQVVLNLLSNAVKFTPTSGEIHVRVGRTLEGGQFLSILDNGPGIPEEELPIVLQAFGQGAVAVNTAEHGSGLGLSIVQALVGMHQGTFELKSKLREGTEARATFPKQRIAGPARTFGTRTNEPGNAREAS